MSWTEAPDMTVGVANWIRDEQGAYVGARLWIKIGDPCCTEPLVYGDTAVLARDPGFEDHLFVTGGGPEGNEIPFSTSGGGLYWRSDFNAGLHPMAFTTAEILAPASTGWLVLPGNNTDWRISDVNPRSGLYHARLAAQLGSDLMMVGGFACNPHLSLGRVPYTARVDSGDTIRFGFWASTTGNRTVRADIRVLSQTAGFAQISSPTTPIVNLTSEYQYLEFTHRAGNTTGSTINAGSYYVRCSVRPVSGTGDLDVEDAELEITYNRPENHLAHPSPSGP